jgi:glycosyltransferase involved in cell wall biosynthesis
VVRAVTFAVPGDLATPTGGYVYDRRIVAELRLLGWDVDVLGLGGDFPRPSSRTRAAARAQLAALPAGRLLVIDGLAFGALPDVAEALHETLTLVALVHHPLAFETGLAADEVRELHQSEQAALSFARRVIVTSASTARLLIARYAVAAERIATVQPGTDPASIACRRPDRETVDLLAVGSVIPRKGYDLLIAALASLCDRPWRLVIAGDRGRDPATSHAIDREIAINGLADRITMLGAVSSERLSTLYSSADLMVLPSRFEGFGMVYAEAIAHGLPVLGTTAGAIPEAVPEGAGVLVAPDDLPMLTSTLRRLLENADERSRLAAGARAAARKLPTWQQAGRQFAQALEAPA